MQPFVLTSDVSAFQSEDSRFVAVPRELPDKQAVLSWYAKALSLPEYFGANWDAFDECLRDLSWIKERRVVLYHWQLPLEANPKDQKIYIDLLGDVVRDWKPGEAHEVIAAFHPVCELKLQAVARRHRV